MSKGNIRHCEYCDFSEDGDIDNPCPGITIDYEAAIERARTYLSHHASYEEQIRQAVNAALGGEDETL